jgi:hypothetical protein
LILFFDGRELWDTGIYSRQDAKMLSSELFSLGGLCAFARDIPVFGCGVAALGASW